MRLQMPITKYDVEKRLVSGFATLDNVDQHGDRVTKESSQKAFSEFRGNIREMHQPIAAGKLADFREEEFYDPKTAQKYTGVYVTAYISKGAQDTWEKVLDGTLSGFSIGGSIVDSSTEFNKDSGENVRIIKDYSLTELSLVDSPANQFSNVFSITKSTDGDFMKGMIADTTIVNVFWCNKDEIAKQSKNDSEICFQCDNAMEQIGWFEKGQGDEENAVRETIQKFLNKDKSETSEGGVSKMAEENVETEKVAEEVPAETKETEVAPEEEVTTTEEEKKPEGEFEEAPSEPDFEKMFNDLRGAVTDELAKSKEDISKVVEGVESQVSEVKKSFDEATSELRKDYAALSERLDAVKEQRQGVEKRLEALEAGTAIKKSNEVETAPEDTKIAKGVWSGSILG